MRVLLFHASTNFLMKPSSLPLGLLSIATYLKKNGHTVKICDRQIKRNNIKREIKDFSPDIVGISAPTNLAVADALKISETVKNFDIPVVWGGQMPTAVPEQVLQTGCVDYVIMSEGEVTWLELIIALENKKVLDDVKGLVFVKGGEMVVTPCREFADLAELPIIDFSLINPEKCFQTWIHCRKLLYLYASKGCPFNCTFCFNEDFNKSTCRKRPVEYVLSEIEYLVKNHGMDGVNFADELLCFTRSEIETIRKVRDEKKLDFFWGGETRATVYSKDDLQLMYDAGCRWLLFGIESGSEEVRRKVKKSMDMEAVFKAVKDCADVGISTFGTFIVGFPEETELQLRETVQMALNLKLDMYLFHYLGTFPNSALFNYMVKNNLYNPPTEISKWRKINPSEKLYINLANVSKRDVIVVKSYFDWMTFKNKDSVKGEKKYVFVRKSLDNALSFILKKGPFLFVINLFLSAKLFLRIFWNANAYPKILKKYDLK